MTKQLQLPRLSEVQPLFLTMPTPGKPQVYADTAGRVWFRMLSEDGSSYSEWEELKVVSSNVQPFSPPAVPENQNTPHFDTIALDTARGIMCDVNRRHELLGGDVQLLSRIQCRIDEACRAAMLKGGSR